MKLSRAQLDIIAEKLAGTNPDHEIMTFIVGPEYPSRLYELQKEINAQKGIVHPYKELPMEELKVYAVKTASPNIVDVQFSLVEISKLGLDYTLPNEQL
jgi:hypothetical protein